MRVLRGFDSRRTDQRVISNTALEVRFIKRIKILDMFTGAIKLFVRYEKKRARVAI